MRWPPGLLDPPEDVMEPKPSLESLFKQDCKRARVPYALRGFGWCLYCLGATAVLEILHKAEDQEQFDAAITGMIEAVYEEPPR